MKKVFLCLLGAWTIMACNPTNQKQDSHAQKQENDSLTLTVAVMPTVDCLPFYYAYETGIFNRLDANISLKTYFAQMDCDTAFCKQHADVAYTDLIRAALLQSKGTPLYVFMQTDGYHELVTAVSKRIRQPKQMKEKMVGMARHSVTDYLCDVLVEKGKFKADELYQPQINDIALRTAMLQNATLDAAFLPDPYATQAQMHQNRGILNSKNEKIQLTAMMVHRNALKKAQKAKALKGLIAGYNQAVDELKLPENQIKAKHLLRPYQVEQATLDSLKLPTYSIAKLPEQEQIQQAVNWIEKENLLKHNYNGDSLTTKDLIK